MGSCSWVIEDSNSTVTLAVNTTVSGNRKLLEQEKRLIKFDIKNLCLLLNRPVSAMITTKNPLFETFDIEMYEEIVGCYRALSFQLLDAAQVIIDNQASWNEVKNKSIKTIKRVLSAG